MKKLNGFQVIMDDTRVDEDNPFFKPSNSRGKIYNRNFPGDTPVWIIMGWQNAQEKGEGWLKANCTEPGRRGISAQVFLSSQGELFRD